MVHRSYICLVIHFRPFPPQEIWMKLLIFLHLKTPTKKLLAYQPALNKMTLHEFCTWSLVVNMEPMKKIKPCPACWQSSGRTSGSIPDLVICQWLHTSPLSLCTVFCCIVRPLDPKAVQISYTMSGAVYP